MSKRCCIPNCRSIRYGLHLFGIPRNEDLRIKWLDIILGHFNHLKFHKNFLICEYHFEPKCFSFAGGLNKILRLTKGSYPTIFENYEKKNDNLENKKAQIETYVIKLENIDSDEDFEGHIETENFEPIETNDDTNIGSKVIIKIEDLDDNENSEEYIVPEILKPNIEDISLVEVKSEHNNSDSKDWPKLEILPGCVIKNTKLDTESNSTPDNMMFACALCHQRFDQLHFLKSHVTDHKIENRKASRSHERGNEKSKLIKSKSIPNNKVFDCPLCHQSFEQSHLLRSHVREHKKFEERKALTGNKKIQKHGHKLITKIGQNVKEPGGIPDNKLFACALCHHSFEQLHLLRSHVTEHKKFKRRKTFSGNRKIHIKLGQKLITKIGPNVNGNKKIQFKHGQKPITKIGHNAKESKSIPDNNMFACAQCHQSFEQLHLLTLHVRDHKKLEEGKAGNTKIQLEHGQKFITKIGHNVKNKNYRGNTKIQLEPGEILITKIGHNVKGNTKIQLEHGQKLITQIGHNVKESNSTPDNKIFVCGLCHQNFEQLDLLRSHVKDHKKFEERTALTDNTKIQLEREQKLSTKIEHKVKESNKYSYPDNMIFACAICPQSFKQLDLLRSHVREHKKFEERKAIIGT